MRAAALLHLPFSLCVSDSLSLGARHSGDELVQGTVPGCLAGSWHPTQTLREQRKCQ